MSKGSPNIQSITQLHRSFGFSKPKHPLVSVVQASEWKKNREGIDVRYKLDLYTVSLKDKRCGFFYGRKPYDFDESVMRFTEPNETVILKNSSYPSELEGWMLVFHSDLFRNTSLEDKIDNYNFFFYAPDEALHLSDSEERIILNCIDLIKNEVNERIDNHSQTVIVSTLELLLNLCARFYERQFNTRSVHNNNIILQVNLLLQEYFDLNYLTEKGIPKVKFLAEKVGLSLNYLSDLLEKQTGKNAKTYIYNFIIDKAKTILIESDISSEELSKKLGFRFPNYFKRLFKLNTGMSPEEYKLLH